MAIVVSIDVKGCVVETQDVDFIGVENVDVINKLSDRCVVFNKVVGAFLEGTLPMLAICCSVDMPVLIETLVVSVSKPPSGVVEICGISAVGKPGVILRALLLSPVVLLISIPSRDGAVANVDLVFLYFSGLDAKVV